jgi:hypothetical protein
MGIRLSLILIKDDDHQPLSRLPVGSDKHTQKILWGLGYVKNDYLGDTTLFEGWFPPEDEVCIGSFENGYVIADLALVRGLLRNPAKDMERRYLLDLFPTHSILIAHLNSTVNGYGYAKFVDGAFIRSQSGDAEKPVRFDEGVLFPIEEEWRSKSVVKKRRRYYRAFDSDDEYSDDDASIGESIVQRLVQDHIGGWSDWMDAESFSMQRFRKSARFVIWRRSSATRTAMIEEVFSAVAEGKSHPAMTSIGTASVLEGIRKLSSGDIRVQYGNGEHGDWISVECPFGQRNETLADLAEIARDNGLLLYCAHEHSVYNNKRVY